MVEGGAKRVIIKLTMKLTLKHQFSNILARARFKYSKILAAECYGFNQTHFKVATDPMRVVSLPLRKYGFYTSVRRPASAIKPQPNPSVIMLSPEAIP
jgi:hypothetical protein